MFLREQRIVIKSETFSAQIGSQNLYALIGTVGTIKAKGCTNRVIIQYITFMKLFKGGIQLNDVAVLSTKA